ncbi:MAG: hypothetical protein NT019_02025 [Candidatus Adlerbacteria bacterium]|nr:hypothetical protein [Candidatus Adlerbacteria bacterium]
MKRIILPVFLFAAALGLFVLYTNPAYQTIKNLSVQNASYDDALTKSAELHSLRDRLLATRASFSNDNVIKLSHVLPDNVDNIRLIIDINNIAARHGLALSTVELGSVSDSDQKRSALAVGSSGAAVGSVQVGFSVAAKYDDFLVFLQDLEHSLRIVDIDKISFNTGPGDLNVYSVDIRTYWLH